MMATVGSYPRLLPPRNLKQQRYFIVDIEFSGPYEIEQSTWRKGTHEPDPITHFEVRTGLYENEVSVSVTLGVKGGDESDAVKNALKKLGQTAQFYPNILADATASTITVRAESARFF